MTIDENRISAMTNSNLPGEYQLCTFRIVSGIPVDLTLAQSGTLLVQIDQRRTVQQRAALGSARMSVGRK